MQNEELEQKGHDESKKGRVVRGGTIFIFGRGEKTSFLDQKIDP
jgi:hypothetical protein